MARVVCLMLASCFALLLQGCASSGGEMINIDQRQLVARQNMPAELTRMLRDLGYDWVPILDPINQQRVKAVVQNGVYRMLFEHLEQRQVRIDVRVNDREGFTRLRFHEPDGKSLGSTSQKLLQQLQQRTLSEFGERVVTW